MISKYLNGSKGSFNLGASGDQAKPYDLNTFIDPYFIGNELALTLGGTKKQLDGTLDMLHSLPAPSSSPELFTPKQNYNGIDQQYTDAEANLKSTPILGTSINQHIAQQQAIGQQGVALDHQKIQTLANMQNSDLVQAAKDEYQNALKRHQDAESRRVFDIGVRQQIQDQIDSATAVKTDAWKKASQEVYSLAKMKELRENRKALHEMQMQYNKAKQNALTSAENLYKDRIVQDFRDQFDLDRKNIQDNEEFVKKYGIGFDEINDSDNVYETDAYKKAFEKYETDHAQDWIDERNKLVRDYDEMWWNNNRDEYFDYYYKSGGTIKEPSKQRYLSKKDRIAIDNNKELHEFVKQMNQKQKEIFLKLMSL